MGRVRQSLSSGRHPLHGHTPTPPTTLHTLERLRLLTFNIQVGIAATRLRHYLTHSWRHLLPHHQSQATLDRIGELIRHFDIVALQEIDSGSFRSQYINQAEYLASAGRFPYWYSQLNRNLGHLGQHSNALLCRLLPAEVTDHRLPGFDRGRGAIEARFGPPGAQLLLLTVHLGLGRRSRLRQMEYLCQLLGNEQHVIVMGDFNCRSQSRELAHLLDNTSLCPLPGEVCTFPSWRPKRNIDHILVSPTLKIERLDVLDETLSDHLPVMVDLLLPDDLRTAWANAAATPQPSE
ncbi:MAG: endonuclease/exonuclease/phosphatase family protein [Gammaproteobacteria bacterium]|nr:endonuclease/exonuclease/phosphatase family protein [Gammaproteobacteria bacterium]